MSFCHGNGDLARDGCCYVNGAVCPLRWKVVDGRVLEGPELADLGTPAEALAANGRSPDAGALLEGVTFACRAAIEVLADDPALMADREGFEQAWDNHPDYVGQVRPHWVDLERASGLDAGDFNCSTWQGTGKPECCFAESPGHREVKASRLGPMALKARRPELDAETRARQFGRG